jgi:hypothetical protein
MAEQTQLLSHWAQHFDGLDQSTQQFYSQIQQAVQRRKMPDVKFSKVDMKEGGVFSSSREYFRVQRGDLRYDICGAPFGSGFFVSSRLFADGKFGDSVLGSMERGGLVAKMAGAVASKVVGADTYYRIDTANMYLQLVHGALLEVVDEMSSTANLPRLAHAERKPILQGFYH